MAEDINSNVAPPGSSESFNDFTDRVLSTITGYQDPNQNTLLVTHSKPIKAFNAWEHAGYPENGDVHLPTYEKDLGTGRVQEVDLPQQALEAREMAVQRLINSTVPGYRKEGKATQWAVEGGQELVNDVLDIVKHPENLVGTGELGAAIPKNPRMLLKSILPKPKEILDTIEGESLLRQRLSEGVPKESIADELGVSSEQVDDKLNKIAREELGVNLGAKPDKEGRIRTQKSTPFRDEELDKISITSNNRPVIDKQKIYDLKKQGLTNAQIREEMGTNVSNDTIAASTTDLPSMTREERTRRWNEAGTAATPNMKLAKEREALFTPEVITRIKQAYAEGRSGNNIADTIGKELNMPKSTFHKTLNRLGIKPTGHDWKLDKDGNWFREKK